MKAKNFVIAGIAGGITDFLLGWIFYGMLFKDYFEPEQQPNMVFIFLGCMTFGFIVSYTIVRWASLVTAIAGLKAGAVIGLLYGLCDNFFRVSMTDAVVNYEHFAADVVIMILLGAGVGTVAAIVNGMLSKPSNN